MRSNSNGFSIIELVVVLAVLGILASVAVPLAELSSTRRKEAELQRALWEVRDAIDAYKRAVEEGQINPRPTVSGYPPTLSALVEGAPTTDAKGRRELYFLRRVPRDPFHPTSDAPPETTWGLRSYDSPPARPKAGDDVYDVYSLSGSVALNGRPYREW